MANEQMFEAAVRAKMRFPFRGNISVEDLWDLSVENLDSIFKSLNSQLKQVQEESLLNTRSREDKELDVKIELVKYIVSVKLEEQRARLAAKDRREQKQKILEILSTKEAQDLQAKSVEDLKQMLNELDD